MNETRKAAIVTGAGQGIGKAIAQRLLREGYAVALAELNAESGRETEAELATQGVVQFVHTDVADEQSVCRCVRQALEQFGRIDALVNNAAIGIGKPVTELALEDWNRVLAVNLTGPLLFAKHAAPTLRAARGAIVNIASTRAFMSEPNTESYSASKGGVVALTHALAVRLGPDVRVNCISPGWIETGSWLPHDRRHEPQHSAQDRAQHPCGRVGTPEDIAGLVAYLLSEAAGFMTGANLMVDGGMTRKMIYV